MGGSAIGGALAARGARRPRLAADRGGARLRAAGVDDARHDGAVRELLGQHRGDAGGLRGGGRARGAADRRDHRRQARRRGARRRRAGDPAAGRLPAAGRGRATRSWSRSRWPALCGAGERLHAEIDVAAAHVEALVDEWGPGRARGRARRSSSRAGCTARSRRSPASGLTAPIAYRWKTQINENAKIPASPHELPELDHNEIVGWEGAGELGRFSAVFLDDSDLHPRDPPADRADAGPDREPRRPARSASRAAARRAPSGWSRSSCSATSSRSTSRSCAGVDPTPVAIDRAAEERAARGQRARATRGHRQPADGEGPGGAPANHRFPSPYLKAIPRWLVQAAVGRSREARSSVLPVLREGRGPDRQRPNGSPGEVCIRGRRATWRADALRSRRRPWRLTARPSRRPNSSPPIRPTTSSVASQIPRRSMATPLM